MFNIHKNIAAMFIAIMLLAQIGMAQHSVVHFDAHGHYEQHSHDDDSDDHRKNVHEACQICLLIKSLSFGVVSDYTNLVAPIILADGYVRIHDQIATNHRQAFYNPRAPPAALI